MGKESTVKSRLLEYLKYKHLTQTEFTRSLGVSATYVGAMRKGIPSSRVKIIGDLYPDLNRDWLLYGDGEMLLDATPAEPVRLSEEYETLLLPMEAFAGDLQLWSKGVKRSDCRTIVSPVSGADFAIPIRGDSMEPRFHDGSTLLIKRINENMFIPWGHTLVIDTENGVFIKNVYPSDKKGEKPEDTFIEARSLNPSYPPFAIPMSSVYGLYRVMGTIDLFPNV